MFAPLFNNLFVSSVDAVAGLGHIGTDNVFTPTLGQTSGQNFKSIINIYPFETAVAATAKCVLANLYEGPAGSSDLSVHTPLVEGLLVGNADTTGSGFGYSYIFPLTIQANITNRIKLGAQTDISTAGDLNIYFRRDFLRSAAFHNHNGTFGKLGSYVETVGVDFANSKGTDITPGSNGAFGAWTYLGDTSLSAYWWQLGFNIKNATITSLLYTCQLGFGSFAEPTILIPAAKYIATTIETIRQVIPTIPYIIEVPVGAPLFARVACSGTPVTGCHVAAYGVGG